MPRITIQATVPAGKKTGETFTAKTPSGTDVQVTVPKNAPPGAKLEIMVEETVKVTPNKETVNATPNPLKQPLGTPLELESQTQTPSIKNLPIAVAADEWERSGKLYGQPGTNGWFFGNFIYNQRNRHPALQPFFTPRIQCDSQREHEEKRTFLKLSFLMSFGIGLAIFSSLGAIDFYKALDCACGCEEFTWPPTREAILNDPRYDESYWPVGQPMCYPIKGRKLDDTKATLNGKKWPLGPAYNKPVPLQYCAEADANCDCGNNCEFNKGDPLYLWSVSVDVVNGVIMGKPDHHCKEDDCYYVKRDVYENHLCEPSLEQGSEQYYWVFIVSELIQFVVSFLLLRARKESMESLNKCFGCLCCCGCVFPMCFFIVIAAIANSVFAQYLFLPFMFSKAAVWASDIVVVPLVTLPTYISHKLEFQHRFPGCKSLDDVRAGKSQNAPDDDYDGGLLAKFAKGVMLFYNVLTKAT